MPANTMDMSSFTVAQFVIMGIFALLAVAGILFGMRLKRQRLAAQEDTEEHREAAGVPADSRAGDAAADAEDPVAPKTTHIAVATGSPAPSDAPSDPPPAVATPGAVQPPVAPAPPPLGDTIDDAPQPTLPLAPDSDIRQLKGLGPKLAATLADLGVTRVDQIAAMSPAELEALDARLGTFRCRPARDRWAEQARLLTAGDRAGYEAAFGKLGG